MAWLVTYQEESKDQEITDHEVKKGYMYASEILTLNGFLANQFDGKTQEAVVKGLLQDCYQSFGIDPKNPGFDLEQPHPKLPELNKFWYMKKLLSSTDRSISETHGMDPGSFTVRSDIAYFSLKGWCRKIKRKLQALKRHKLCKLKKNKKGIKVLCSLPLKLVKAVKAKF